MLGHHDLLLGLYRDQQDEFSHCLFDFLNIGVVEINEIVDNIHIEAGRGSRIVLDVTLATEVLKFADEFLILAEHRNVFEQIQKEL